MSESYPSPPSTPRTPRTPRGDKYCLKYKVLILGDRNVGKSAITYRLRKKNDNIDFNNFIATPRTPRSSIKMEMSDLMFRDVQCKDKTIKFQIWDFCYHEPDTLPKFYFEDVAAVIFVCDINKPSTLEHLKYWLKEANLNIEHYYQRVIFANKLDESSINNWNEITVDYASVIRQIDPAFCLPVSAKSGQYLEDALVELGNELLKYPKTPQYGDKKYEHRNSANLCVIS